MRMKMATPMATITDTLWLTASSIRDIRNMKLPMTAKATRGMVSGSMFTGWPRCSPAARALTTTTVSRPKTTPTMVSDTPYSRPVARSTMAPAPASGVPDGAGKGLKRTARTSGAPSGAVSITRSCR